MEPKSYDFKAMENKWQRQWEENKLFSVTEDKTKKKYYVLEMFPYPSGKLHMGHVRNYVIGDVISRYKRMQGFNVLHPIGWDAFGLPAENAAIKHKIDPETWTKDNINYMRRQLKQIGVSYDWTREFATCDKEYYRWNQWFFVKFYEKGLVYRKKSLVNWCPSCKTVLANEQVDESLCWRCDTQVKQKELEQWFFRITDYSEELLEGHKILAGGWAERILLMQKNWIGKSFGTEIDFPILNSPKPNNAVITVFTTRPDTLGGVTYMVLAPEHPLVEELTKDTRFAETTQKFVEKVKKQNKIVRTAEDVKKEGMFIGAYCQNPVNGDKISIWIANYVLLEYGTGAVMAVPAHDTRDFAFAKEYNLPIKIVIKNPQSTVDSPQNMTEAYEGEGTQVNSGQFDGLPSKEGMGKITDYLIKLKRGRRMVNYRLRDWLISRQRYWGTPIPVIYCDKCGIVPVPEKDLPVVLPRNVEFTGTGVSPLATIGEFVKTNCPKCNQSARRETDTMDTFVDSSWYYARYCDASNPTQAFSREKAAYWLPVDQYIGGAEHACMHLIYSRFFHKVMRDLGLVKNDEPFLRLLNQGMVSLGGTAMSKSKGNITSPDEVIGKYGADTCRLFTLFASPPQKDLEWSEASIEGAWRFLNRVWRIVNQVADGEETEVTGKADQELRRFTHITIKKVTEDIEKEFAFNTAISAIMELVNGIYDLQKGTSSKVLQEALETVVVLLSIFTPHIAEEMWKILHHQDQIIQQKWPTYNREAIQQKEITIVIQVNGKVRSKIQVPVDKLETEIKEQAKDDIKVKKFIEGKSIVNIIYVPKKLINIVVN